MPTRKQRRRAAKEKRHEYETVWVDAEGNELEEPPEDGVEPEREARRGDKPKSRDARRKAPQQRGGRGVRTPPEPSWQRAGRRALLLGVVVFVLFYIGARNRGSSGLYSALGLAGLYTLLFIPFTYAIDRFAYNRWLRRQGGGQGGGKRPTKKKS